MATLKVNSLKKITRRRLIGSGLGLIVAVPAIRIGILKSKDKLLPAIATPELIMVDGWLLDIRDAG